MIVRSSRSGSQKRQTASLGISFRPVDILALDFIKEQDRRHRSAVVQVLIDEEMKRRVGRDWEAQLLADASEPATPELAALAS